MLPTVPDAAAELARELRAELPAAADEAINEGLGFLPRVLRTVVRKALMG